MSKSSSAVDGGTAELATAISVITKDHSKLAPLLRTLSHSVGCGHPEVNIRAHYLPFRNGKPITGELIEVVSRYITHFALPRTDIERAHASAEACTDPDEKLLIYNALRNEAADTFIKAQKATNRNGEAGELILYLLIEWLLEAPQVLAKMGLKTSGEMPVHGSDGIHIKFDELNNELVLIWGESKLHKTIEGAIASAIGSISDSLNFNKMKKELSLIRRNFLLSGISPAAEKTLLTYLDPLNDNYERRVDCSACLIGFDFDEFSKTYKIAKADLEPQFCMKLTIELERAAAILSKNLSTHGINQHRMEIFFLPLPSVEQLRVEFQDRIGWKND